MYARKCNLKRNTREPCACAYIHDSTALERLFRQGTSYGKRVKEMNRLHRLWLYDAGQIYPLIPICKGEAIACKLLFLSFINGDT